MDKRKYFIITVDTEEDKQWDPIPCFTTENSHFIPRFQNLCEKYGFKPVYLVTYLMAKDEFFVNYIKPFFKTNRCEIGMHMHAWTTPPEHPIDKCIKKPFIIEYPNDIIEKKVAVLTELLSSTFGQKIESHRSGRWVVDDNYLGILKKYGYKIDCSFTPYINWSRVKGGLDTSGTNYNKFNSSVFNESFLEVPVSIIKRRTFSRDEKLLKNIKNIIFGKSFWMRPNSNFNSLRNMIKVIDDKYRNNPLVFMIHSSELMPGCSPEFPDEESISELYSQLEKVFDYLKINGYVGVTLKEYYSLNGGE